MPTATVKCFRTYINFKGGIKAKEFQKTKTADWLRDNLKEVSQSRDL